MHTYDVAIIGAGAAGLSAAYNLKRAGINNILVLEAQDYVGGRIKTFKDWGAPVELGAEAVHGKGTALWPYLDKFNVEALQDVPVSVRKLVGSDGRILSKPEVERFNFLHHVCSESGESGTSLAEYLGRLTTPEEKEIYDLVAGSLRDLEASDAAQLDSGHYARYSNMTPDHSDHWLITGGYDQVIHGFANKLQIQLNSSVINISWDGSVNKITLHTGEQISATKVIVTVSLGVLQHESIQFVPELPADKLSAIKSIGMGHTAKLLLKFKNQFIGSKTIADNYSSQSRVAHTLNLVSSWWVAGGDPTVLVGFMGGSQADKAAALGEAALIQTALTEVSQLTGETANNEFVAGKLVNWLDNPHIRGSYSNNPLAMPSDAHIKLAASLDSKLFFAGEATVDNGNYGTVHGAIESGERAANEVLKALKSKE